MKRTVILLLLLVACLPVAVHADDTFGLYAGVNGVWTDDNAQPADFELGLNGKASLSPHLSLVAASYYGFGHEYVRGSGGFRITATDVNDQNFSVGIGMQYHASSQPDIRPEEWKGDVSLGWCPWAERRNLSLIAQGSYGLNSSEASALAGLRYAIGGAR